MVSIPSLLNKDLHVALKLEYHCSYCVVVFLCTLKMLLKYKTNPVFQFQTSGIEISAVSFFSLKSIEVLIPYTWLQVGFIHCGPHDCFLVKFWWSLILSMKANGIGGNHWFHSKPESRYFAHHCFWATPQFEGCYQTTTNFENYTNTVKLYAKENINTSNVESYTS